MNNSVIVLGGSGFLGTEILKALKKIGVKRIACGSRKPCQIESIEDIPTDLLNLPNLAKSCQPFDTIINCVGQVSSPINSCIRLNSEGISNITKVAKTDNKRVIQISTMAVYGTANSVNEKTPVNPETTYATAKYFAEHLLRCELPPEQLTIIRLSNLFGSNQPKGIFSYLIKSFHTNRQLEFNNDGSLNRFYIHTEDAAFHIALLTRKDGFSGIYNLTGNESYSIRQLINLIETMTGSKFKVSYEKTVPYENIRNVSNQKIKSAIPMNFNHNVKDFLSQQIIY